jgi:flagellar basal-body rod modification protein FlgD
LSGRSREILPEIDASFVSILKRQSTATNDSRRTVPTGRAAAVGSRPESAMTVSAVSTATTTTTSTTSSTTSSSSLSSTDFLELLIVELQNQNPTDPTSTTDFMNQLMSYSTYSQLTDLNDSLSDLTSSLSDLQSANATQYIGYTVEADGDTTTLEDGSAKWGYTLDSKASEVTITITDSNGDTVYTGNGETSAGSHVFTWDGTTSDGTQLDDGETYTISVSATDADGESIDTSTTIIGKVDGVDTSGDSVALIIGGVYVNVDDVIGIAA